jgi:arginase
MSARQTSSRLMGSLEEVQKGCERDDMLVEPASSKSRMRDVSIIGVASGWGARDRRCEDGPQALHESGILHCVTDPERGPPTFEILQTPENAQAGDVLRRVIDIDNRLASLVAAKLRHGELPVVVGGDHSCAIGTWSGVRSFLAPQDEMGLIWVDAHMDSHVPETSPSGALHGMPLACLLGYGLRGLITLAGPAPKLRPQHVCLIGVRSFEPGEESLLERLGVRVFLMEEVRARGFPAIWDEAVRHVSRGTVGYGVTIDLDAIDPQDAPGVGTPERAGIAADDLIRTVQRIHDDSKLLAMEIAEYNPHADHDRLTLRLLRRLICAAVAGKDSDD